MNNLLQNLANGFRTLRRAPRFTALAAVTLALGIGASTALLSVVYSGLLAPLPFPDQERLMVLWENSVKHQFGLVEFSYPNLIFWRAENTIFERLGAFDPISIGMSLAREDEPAHVDATSATHDFFTTFGTQPALGRTFRPEEDRVGAPHVAVLSHRMWQRLFAGDPQIVGRQLKLDSDSYTAVGVMPEAFKYPRGADLWIPLMPALGKENSELRLLRAVRGIGRLKSGVTVAQAQTEVVALAKRLEKDHPETNDGISAAVVPLTEEIFGETRFMFLTLLVGTLLLLVMAGANVANLLLSRSREGQPEKLQGARQVLREGLALIVLGGLVLAFLGVRLLRAKAPENIPRVEHIHLDWRIFLFTLVVSALTIVIFGALPALWAGRRGEGERYSPAGARVSWLRRFAVGLELALALVLLTGTGLMARSVLHLRHVDLGYVKDNALTMRIWLPEKSYPEVPQRQEFFDRLLERVQALPGVVSAATVSARPLDASAVYEMPIVLKGQDWGKQITNPLTNFEAVSPSYFQTMGIRVVGGRNFNADDTATSQPVVIVSQSLAARFWPGQNPVGKIVRQFLPENTVPWMVVVGVVTNAKYRGLDVPRYDFYTPAKQNPLAKYMDYQDLIVRTVFEPFALAQPIRKAVHSLDPNLSISSTLSLQNLVGRELAAPQFALLLMGIFGFLAVYLAAVGVYGLLSHLGAQRSREIGVRMALGARRREVVRMVVVQGFMLIAGALGVGILAALALTRFMSSLLFEVNTRDPLTFTSVAVLLALVAVLTTLLAARRASRTEPVETLRS
jgi:putative ABC transport system permease protein